MTEADTLGGSGIKRWSILAAAAAAAVAVSSGIGILPTYRTAGPQAALALGIAAGVVWAVSAAAAVPIALWPASNPRAMAQAMQIGMGVRFALTLAAALALAFGTGLPRTPLLLWLGIHYMVALAMTTVAEIRLLHRKDSEAPS